MRRVVYPFHGSLTAIDAAGAAIAVVLTLTLLYGALLPMHARNKQQSAARQTAVRESQRHAGLITAGHTLKQEIDRARQEIASSPLQISSEDSLNQRLADLARLSNECSLSVEDLKPDEALQAPPFLLIPVRISGRGSYQSCAMFIHSLHKQLPDIEVRSFKLTGAPNDPTIQGSFEFRLGWYASSRGAAPQTAPRLTATIAQ